MEGETLLSFSPKDVNEATYIKLDGVGPVDNKFSTTSFTTLSSPSPKKTDIWHAPLDMWHVTHDTWYVTRHRWGEVNLLSKLKLSSSYGLGMKVFWRFGEKGWFIQFINYQLIRDKRVCKTAPATPGLLTIAWNVPVALTHSSSSRTKPLYLSWFPCAIQIEYLTNLANTFQGQSLTCFCSLCKVVEAQRSEGK